MIFQIRIAEKNIRIYSMYEKVYFLCRDYIIDESSIDFEVRIHQADIDYERQKFQKNEKELGLYTYYSDAYLETLAIYRKIALKMLDYDTFLMHGSVVAVDNKGYMFLASSGTGKTTHTRLWMDNIPGTAIINGDKPLIMIREGTAYVCGTPWCGKENYNSNRIVELKFIYMLSRAKENSVEEVSFKEAFPMLLQQTYKPTEANAMIKTIKLLNMLNHTGKYYELRCNRAKDSAIMAYKQSKN